MLTASLLLATGIAAAAATTTTAAAAAAAATDWRQFGRTAQNQAFTSAGLPTKAHAEWFFNATDRVVASPVVSHGKVWIATDAGTLVQLDQETAAVQWTWTVPAAKNYPACLACIGQPKCECPLLRSTPAITEDGSIIIGSYDNNVYKFDIAGKLLWTFATDDVVYAPVTLDDDAHVAYVGSWDGYLYAIDENTGKELWKFKVGSNGDCSVSVGEAGSKYANTVVLGSNEGGTCDGLGLCYVFAVDKTTGKELWRTKVGKEGISGGGTIAGDAYYAGAWNAKVASYDLGTGNMNWQVDAKGSVQSRPAYYDGMIYFSIEDTMTLMKMKAATGEVVWQYSGATQEFNGSPSIDTVSGIVYAGANDKYLHAVNMTSGALLFKFETCANVFASAAIADSGMVYIGCNTVTGNRKPGIGAAYAIDPRKHM